MAIQTELKAATDRLRANNYPVPDTLQYRNDRKVTSEAYLREHREDETPIDAAWLESIGFRVFGDTNTPLYSLNVSAVQPYRVLVQVQQPWHHGNWWVGIALHTSVPLSNKYWRTRGDLRRLLVGLGVEIKA